MIRTKHRIGGYRVIAPIGAGGFATVYRALDEAKGDEVAIKVLAENHSLVADMRRRFVDEVDLLATVDSPSIAKIYERGETETGQPFMVLELADRGDLRRRLDEIRRKRQKLTRADLIMLASHLYEALNTLHESEIIHRDVSPGNILIRSRKSADGPTARSATGGVTLLEPGERFLLADLGHAKDMFRASGFTAGGGTQGYASPEQLDNVTVVDHRADIYSATAVMEWAAHDGDYAMDLDPFFEIGLAADPDDRFTNMTEWHQAFSTALGSTVPEPRTARFARLRSRFNLQSIGMAIGALAIGVLAAVALVIGLGSRTDTDDPAQPTGTTAPAAEDDTGPTTTDEAPTPLSIEPTDPPATSTSP